jgi:2-amino-4-hydroxy-6-hydroxymethyldihydropteridine diphosphokinase
MTTAYIGMGGNVASAAGEAEATLAAAVKRLAALGRVVAQSRLYSTAPVGFADQPRFVNAVVGLETGLAPRALLGTLLAIEQEFGRDRSSGVRNGPRTLDLDLLLFGAAVIDEPDLLVPHPRLGERAFVLVPLSEIAPEVVDPRSGLAVAALLERLKARSGDEGDAVRALECEVWTARMAGAEPCPDKMFR